MLSGKRILVGVSGSIAAYKAPDIIRRLREQGASVHVVMTAHAARFVTPLTFEAVSGNPVLCDEFEGGPLGPMGHIAATDGIDGVLIAPATANIIAKAAAGIADDTLSTVLLAASCPLFIAPAMNDRMYAHPAVRQNIRTLTDRGAVVIDPEPGALACGSSGQGRLASTEAILRAVQGSLAPGGRLSGTTVLVTAGPTREPIDAVRFISNPSTGKMGFAIAAAARDQGANVILVHGPTQLAPPAGVRTVPVMTAEEMRKAVNEHAGPDAVVIMSAAVSDFRPASRTDRKVKKEDAPASLALERTVDILEELGREKGGRLLIGFAAETDNLLENAKRKLDVKHLDMIVANDILEENCGFGSESNRAVLLDRDGGAEELPLMTKSEMASKIIDKIAELTAKQGL